MLTRSDLETRHVVLARIVASINSDWVTRGSLATTFRFTFTIVQPGGSLSKVSVAVVTISPSVKPPDASSSESAKEKLLACAAAINSGGSAARTLVRGRPAETPSCCQAPFSVVTVLELPVASSLQWREAVRVIFFKSHNVFRASEMNQYFVSWELMPFGYRAGKPGKLGSALSSVFGCCRPRLRKASLGRWNCVICVTLLRWPKN